MTARNRLYQIIEVDDDNDKLSKIYDWFMMIAIVLSLVPIIINQPNHMVDILDKVTVMVFIADYILRLCTADKKIKKGFKSFLIYPFTPMAIIDIVSILPSIIVVSSVFRVFKIFRLLRTLRVFRVFKVIRYSKSIRMIMNVFKKQKESLMVVCGLAVGYIVVSALVVYSVEPDTFQSFFDAVYWATVSLTTVGYGDIYAVSIAGKIITMFSALFGIAIVALPAGIITAGYMTELNKEKEEGVDTHGDEI